MTDLLVGFAELGPAFDLPEKCGVDAGVGRTHLAVQVTVVIGVAALGPGGALGRVR